jgi:hypothetical protein
MRIDVKDLYKEHWEWCWCEYQPMLNAFGKIVLQVDDIAYQGDSRVLYDNDGEIGVLIFGWGSCSGCDALQACNSLEDVQELCNELQDSIRWFDDKQSALEYFKTHDWEGDCFGLGEETVRFVSEGIKYLSGDQPKEKDGEQA